MTQRFIQLADVSEVLNISSAQAYALVRSGELPAIKVGGRGQWRVEATELESYIQRMYSETKTFVEAHPFGAGRRSSRPAAARRGPTGQAVRSDATAANGTTRWAVTFSGRRGKSDACSLSSRASAPTPSIVPVTAAPPTSASATTARSRLRPRSGIAEPEPPSHRRVPPRGGRRRQPGTRGQRQWAPARSGRRSSAAAPVQSDVPTSPASTCPPSTVAAVPDRGDPAAVRASRAGRARGGCGRRPRGPARARPAPPAAPPGRQKLLPPHLTSPSWSGATTPVRPWLPAACTARSDYATFTSCQTQANERKLAVVVANGVPAMSSGTRRPSSVSTPLRLLTLCLLLLLVEVGTVALFLTVCGTRGRRCRLPAPPGRLTPCSCASPPPPRCSSRGSPSPSPCRSSPPCRGPPERWLPGAPQRWRPPPCGGWQRPCWAPAWARPCRPAPRWPP